MLAVLDALFNSEEGRALIVSMFRFTPTGALEVRIKTNAISRHIEEKSRSGLLDLLTQRIGRAVIEKGGVPKEALDTIHQGLRLYLTTNNAERITRAADVCNSCMQTRQLHFHFFSVL